MILDLLQKLSTLLLFLLKLDAQHALLDEFLEILFSQAANVVFVIGVHFFFILFLEELLNLFLVEEREWIGSDDLAHQLLLARGRLTTHRDQWLLCPALSHKVEQLVLVRHIIEHLPDLLVLLLDGAVGFDTCLVVGHRLVVDRELLFLVFQVSLELQLLLQVLLLIDDGLVGVVEHDGESDHGQFLLHDAHVKEQLLFEKRRDALLEPKLNFNDFTLDLLEILLPGLPLLVLELLFLLEELLHLELLLLSHLLGGLVHPVLSHQLHLSKVGVFLKVELSTAHHGLEAALPDVVSLHGTLSLFLLSSLLLKLSSLFFGEILLNLDIFFLHIENVVGILQYVCVWLEQLILCLKIR